MPTATFNFKQANTTDNPLFPKASSSNYNENIQKTEDILKYPYFSGGIATTVQAVADSVDASENLAVTWILLLRDSTSGRQSYLTIMANTDGTSVRFNKVHLPLDENDRLAFSVDVDLDSGNIRLLITNNETTTIQGNGQRISPFLKTSF
jgi:hypothetical protein